MDEREVRSKSDALQKALSAREPAANILNILHELKTGVKPSEELLRKTQIGRVVNKIKGLSGIDERIPRLASEIVLKWRNEVQGSKKAGTSGGATPTRNGNASPAPGAKSTSPSEAKASDPPSTTPTGVPLDKRSWKTDKLAKDSMHTDPVRATSISLLYDGLVAGASLPAAAILHKASAIEKAVIGLADAQSSPSTPFYKEKIRSLYQNLKNKSHPELRQRILSGDISPERFAAMTHEEMKSDSQRAEEAKIAKDNMSNAMVPQEERSISDHLECSKCKQKKVSFTQAQTRSADEPMTTFCRCEVCGNRWKFS